MTDREEEDTERDMKRQREERESYRDRKRQIEREGRRKGERKINEGESRRRTCLVCLFCFSPSSSTARPYCGRVPRLTSDNFTCCHT